MRLLLILIVTLVAPASVAAQTVAPGDTLWQKAVAVAAANARWVPGLLVEKETTKNAKGRVEEATEVHVRLFRNEAGAIDAQVLEVRENGALITEAAEALVLASLEEELAEDEADNPFAPAVQNNVVARRLAQSQPIEGRHTVAFAYTQHTPTTTWEGTAWLDAETGVPLRLATRPHDMPPNEDAVAVTALSMQAIYNAEAGAWYPTRVQVDLAFTLRYALFLTFRGTVENVTTLSQYWVHNPSINLQ